MPKTVLIIEDDPDLLTIYHDALARRGYRVLTATQGAEGVTLARRQRVHLILMDLRMPIMDGPQALRYLKTDPYTRHIPVWAISAYLSEAESAQERSERIRFDRLLPKDMDPRILVSEVEDALGTPNGRRN